MGLLSGTGGLSDENERLSGHIRGLLCEIKCVLDENLGLPVGVRGLLREMDCLVERGPRSAGSGTRLVGRAKVRRVSSDKGSNHPTRLWFGSTRGLRHSTRPRRYSTRQQFRPAGPARHSTRGLRHSTEKWFGSTSVWRGATGVELRAARVGVGAGSLDEGDPRRRNRVGGVQPRRLALRVNVLEKILMADEIRGSVLRWWVARKNLGSTLPRDANPEQRDLKVESLSLVHAIRSTWGGQSKLEFVDPEQS